MGLKRRDMRKTIPIIVFLLLLPFAAALAKPVRVQNKERLERVKAVEKIKREKGLDELLSKNVDDIKDDAQLKEYLKRLVEEVRKLTNAIEK